jgi:hypothetical protein
MRQYKKFEDWFEEIENYGMRLERFHDEFSMLDHVKRERMIEWLRAAWDCARMQKEQK